jgi:exopolysaccharide production protein ExoQ
MASASITAIEGQRSWIDHVEAFLAGVAVVMTTSPGLLLMGVSNDPATPENPTLRLYWIPPYLIILALTALRARRLTRYWAPLIPALAIVGWAYASQYWSIDPDVTSRRVVALAMTTLFGFYLGGALDYRRFVMLMAGAFLALSLVSLFLVFAMPVYGIDHQANSGDWRGVWSEKNTLALFMVLGVVSAVSALMIDRRRRWLWAGMLGLCLLLLLMSKGKTALLCVLLTLALTGGLWIMRRGRILGVVTAWATVTVGSIAGFVIWLAPELVLKAVGKDPTLTGRTQIWKAVLDQVALHPKLGFGFAAFWGLQSTPANIIRKQTHWPVPTAHNGWLDLLVQIGWIGVDLFIAALLATIVAVIIRTARTREYFGALFLLIFVAFSFTESFLEQHNSLFWVLFIAVMTHAMGPRDDRPPASKPAPRRPLAPTKPSLARDGPGGVPSWYS